MAGGKGEGDLILSIGRLAENFEDVALEIDDPILADAGLRVGRELAPAVVGEAGVGDSTRRKTSSGRGWRSILRTRGTSIMSGCGSEWSCSQMGLPGETR